MWKRMFALLQQMGKALMLPVSVLPVAGLLLGIGSAKFSKPEAFWWMPEWLATIMKQSGDAIFANLPLLFAIAVVIAFTGNDGASALAAIVGFAVFLAALGAAAQTFFGYLSPQDIIAKGLDPTTVTRLSPEELVAKGLPETINVLKPVMGINTLDTGVFGGLLVGCLAAYLFNKYFRIQLPQYLGFFAGKRFVPIVTGLSAILLAIIMSVVWPPIGNAINVAANVTASGANTAITAAVYGVVERLLLPFGLHHIWNVPFFFEIGRFVDPATNQVVTGDIRRFFAGDKTAGILGGAYWFKMFGLPGAAIAMWRAAYPKNRGRVSGLMFSAAFTSFLTGITEPLEFSFMFVAPLLYGVHALIAGFCQWLFQTMGGKMGFTFSQGAIDFILFNSLGTRSWLILAFGPLFFALYFVIFYFGIKHFNFKTPGREDEEVEDGGAVQLSGGATEMARELVRAFGGRSNIATLDACITRLRITVNDMKKVNKPRLKALGASGVLEVGNSAQAIFGPRSEGLKTDMVEYLRHAGAEADEAYEPNMAEIAAAESMSGSVGTVISEPTIDPDAPAKVRAMIAALGGIGNIRRVDPVALTRLRVEVADSAKVNEEALQAAGVQGILRIPGGKLHLIVGLGADQYSAEMSDQLAKI
ncbi:MAG: glucose-specific PTS transporter subunit IIBC [Leptolyngbya sp. IPPAS B-1204]|nr:MAG: PTS glucose transporter subunit IIB [Leptolyngbya sp. IPPAS B-1204]